MDAGDVTATTDAVDESIYFQALWARHVQAHSISGMNRYRQDPHKPSATKQIIEKYWKTGVSRLVAHKLEALMTANSIFR